MVEEGPINGISSKTLVVLVRRENKRKETVLLGFGAQGR
jgi:hypothetical protein